MSAPDRVVFIPVEGPIEELVPETDLEALRIVNDKLANATTDHFVGEIESGERGLFFVDDTGLVDGLPVNPRATEAYRRRYKEAFAAHGPAWFTIHGPAVGLFGRFAE